MDAYLASKDIAAISKTRSSITLQIKQRATEASLNLVLARLKDINGRKISQIAEEIQATSEGEEDSLLFPIES